MCVCGGGEGVQMCVCVGGRGGADVCVCVDGCRRVWPLTRILTFLEHLSFKMYVF